MFCNAICQAESYIKMSIISNDTELSMRLVTNIAMFALSPITVTINAFLLALFARLSNDALKSDCNQILR